MALTVYSMGDMPIFTSVLNAVAMTFNSSLFDPAQGAGIVVVGLLLGIIFMILPASIGKALDPKPFIFALVLFYGGVLPKQDLQVEDVFTGTGTVVSNIPVIVALPASLVATASKAITDKIETSFSTASGTYLAMGAEGFVNPLKLLLSFRDPQKTQRTFPYFSASVTEFIRYCAPTDGTFTNKALSTAPDMIAYLNSLSNVTGVMTYYNAGNPLGFGTSCQNGKSYLVTDAAAITAAGSDATGLMKTQTAGEYAATTNAASQGASIAGLSSAYSSVTAGIMGNMQNSQQFMVNLIAMTPAKEGVDCINQPTGANMSECMSNVITRNALEQQNVDAAAAASVFSKIAIPTMNVALALFYAVSPIVVGMAFLSAAHGIKIMLSFLLFGAWTQSWMPVAAVLNYMIQMQTQYAFSSFPVSGITMENYMQFYSVLTTKISAASELLAATNTITFALLSGSMIALTGLTGRMGAKDYVDEKMAAPSAGQNDPIVHNGGALEQGYRVQLKSVGGGIVNAPGDTFRDRKDVNAFKDISAGSGSGTTVQEADQLAHTATEEENKQFSKGLSKLRSSGHSEEQYKRLAKSFENSNSDQMKAARSYVESNSATQGWSKDTKERVAAQIAARMSMAPPGPIGQGAMGAIAAGAAQAVWADSGPDKFYEKPSALTSTLATGGAAVAGGVGAAVASATRSGNASLDVQASAERSQTKSSLEDFKKAATSDSRESAERTNSLTTAFSKSYGSDLKQSLSTMFGNEDKVAYAQAHKNAVQAQHTLSAAQARQATFGAASTMKSNEVAAKLVSMAGSEAAVDARLRDALGNMSEADQRKFSARMEKEDAMLKKEGFATDYNAHLAKKIETLYELGGSGESAFMDMAGSIGMTNRGLDSDLNQNQEFGAVTADGAHTQSEVGTRTDGVVSAVHPAERIPTAGGPNHVEVRNATRMAALKTDQTQKTQQPDVSSVPSPGRIVSDTVTDSGSPPASPSPTSTPAPDNLQKLAGNGNINPSALDARGGVKSTD